MGLLYGRAGRLTTKNAGFRPGQALLDGAVTVRKGDGVEQVAAPASGAAARPVSVVYGRAVVSVKYFAADRGANSHHGAIVTDAHGLAYAADKARARPGAVKRP
jgi:hypothetical protein